MQKQKRYVKENKIGEGTYAVIFCGWECLVDAASMDSEIISETLPTGAMQTRRVAIKRFKRTTTKTGIDISTLREIKHLKRITSENVIEVVDVVEQKKQIHLILPYMESNLEVLIKSKNLIFMPEDVKSWMLMICKGLHECHSRFLLHRDVKPNNILVGRDGVLKLADFGLAADLGFPIREMTNQVMTRWYKSPEILMGSTHYSFGIDVWALGCVFAELLLRTPYLPGADDIEQLDVIFQALGTPDIDSWPEMAELPGYKLDFPSRPKPDAGSLFGAAGADAMDLLGRMFVYNPDKRISVEEALEHPYFSNTPLPTKPENLPFDTPENPGRG